MRTIEVSARAALRHTADLGPDAVAQVKFRAMDLLADLEEQVIANGSDPEVLDAIESLRVRLWDSVSTTRRVQ